MEGFGRGQRGLSDIGPGDVLGSVPEVDNFRDYMFFDVGQHRGVARLVPKSDAKLLAEASRFHVVEYNQNLFRFSSQEAWEPRVLVAFLRVLF